MLNPLHLHDIILVYFAGMLDGFAKLEGKEPDKLAKLTRTGSTRYTPPHGSRLDSNFLFTDEWLQEGDSPLSNGESRVFYNVDGAHMKAVHARRVWALQYGGWYAPVAIPFLIAALRYNFIADTFNGGRGPEHFEDKKNFPGFVYTNQVARADWRNTHGIERVFHLGKCIGYHRYQGFLLIGDPMSEEFPWNR